MINRHRTKSLNIRKRSDETGNIRDVIEFTEDFRQMYRQSPTEVELLEICDYLEKVLKDRSKSSIASTLKLIIRDNAPTLQF